MNSVLKGKNSLRYFGSVIWNSLPIEISEDHSISSFVTNKKSGNQLSVHVQSAKVLLVGLDTSTLVTTKEP